MASLKGKMNTVLKNNHSANLLMAMASGFCLYFLSVAKANELSEPEVPYSVAAQYWDANLGSQRAVLRVGAPAPAVRAHIPWRMQMSGMENRQMVVVAADGKTVANVVRIAADRMRADIVFEAGSAGDYHLYFLTMRPPVHMNDTSSYLPYACGALPAWQAAHGLVGEALGSGEWRKLPEAKVIEFQARSELDRFDPMEVIASPAETAAMLARAPQALLLFPEDRTNTIRMQRDIPLRWAKSGPGAVLAGEAQQHEYYAFQIGLYAARQAVSNVAVQFSALESACGSKIAASALTCFNLGGINPHGKPFTTNVNVSQGNIQAMWFGVDVAKEQKPGVYEGTVMVQAQGISPQPVTIKLKVLPGIIIERGDNEPWRHSRLRWLNSTAGTEDLIPEPYTPLKVTPGNTIASLGRTVTLGDGGLPASIAAGSLQVLAEPIRFVIEGQDGPIALAAGAVTWGKKLDSRVEWTAASAGAAGKLECAGEIESDGQLHYTLTFTPAADMQVNDMRLELPYRAESATYIMGVGHPGGLRPKEHRWHWNGPFNSFWLGSPEAGLHCKLLGGSYTGPLINWYNPAPPATWSNPGVGGKGGIYISEVNGNVLAKAFSGARTLKAGQPVAFVFSLLPTPLKPLDQKTHFATRYYHSGDKFRQDGSGAEPEPLPEYFVLGVNVVNVHHAAFCNPYINYPFIHNRKMSEFTAKMHAQKAKVKIYNTVRELTSMTTEIWALRSLGNEVLMDGAGGGGSWCQEHLVTGYKPAWFQRFGDGPPDAAITTSINHESRWLNYYVEGIGWLVRNIGIDGLYLDDVSYDRHIIKRVRTVMAQNKQGCLIDLHSNNPGGACSYYMEFLPYIDRVWFGESVNYNTMTPDRYMVHVSGIPFGLMGEMLHEGGNPWRGPVFGMTVRLGWKTNGHLCDPRPVWKIWDQFGITNATMIGYWQSNCPVKTDHPDMKATAYVKPGQIMIALASWAPAKAETKLVIDWAAIGIDPAKAVLFAPASEGFQTAQTWKPGDAISVDPLRGWLILVDEAGPSAADTTNP